ncbi:MAG: hypothetical protein V3S55_09980 [Nitrospiraceae bacterium]
MHALGTIQYLNNEAIKRARAKAADAGFEAAAESSPEWAEEARGEAYSLADLEACREEALEDGYQRGIEDNEIGWDDGYAYGHDDGRTEAEEEFAGPDPLVVLLRAGGINPYDPVTLVYDATIKAIVYTQGEFSVTQSA